MACRRFSMSSSKRHAKAAKRMKSSIYANSDKELSALQQDRAERDHDSLTLIRHIPVISSVGQKLGAGLIPTGFAMTCHNPLCANDYLALPATSAYMIALTGGRADVGAQAVRGIIIVFSLHGIRIMEAEQQNAILNHLDDLAARAAELRRYL
jgi:hypothetical protein